MLPVAQDGRHRLIRLPPREVIASGADVCPSSPKCGAGALAPAFNLALAFDFVSRVPHFSRLFARSGDFPGPQCANIIKCPDTT